MVHILLKPGLENFEHYFTSQTAYMIAKDFKNKCSSKQNRNHSAFYDQPQKSHSITSTVPVGWCYNKTPLSFKDRGLESISWWRSGQVLKEHVSWKLLLQASLENSHIQLSITMTFYPDTIPHQVLAAWVSGFHALSHCLLVSTDEHCLSHAMIIAVRSPSVWLFAAMDCSPPGSSVHGIIQARILEWVAISYFRGSSWPMNWTYAFCISCMHNASLTSLCGDGQRNRRELLTMALSSATWEAMIIK